MSNKIIALLLSLFVLAMALAIQPVSSQSGISYNPNQNYGHLPPIPSPPARPSVPAFPAIPWPWKPTLTPVPVPTLTATPPPQMHPPPKVG
ncbi:MAG TPA: hypothetical protein VMC84_01530 [Methanocella sp.]|uniref:hypothetical protein n=1 Tax=Methanocella sp. TaxID=2052833 RepID=UPI002D00D4FC|nr:hypothetical protein [Methanocella sp.]HTY89834.1 hypothetical protein [Methanocella sp.]